jgi:hypothetical protein
LTQFADIAQALKYQIRSGSGWDELSGASKEALDQMATCIARTVSGDGQHWDTIIELAQAVRPTAIARGSHRPALDLADMERKTREIPVKE